MFTIEELFIIAGITVLILLVLIAAFYALYEAFMFHRETNAAAREAQLRQDIGNDVHPLTHRGRG